MEGRLVSDLQTGAATGDDLRRLADAGRLYAVLDACDAPAVPEKAWEMGEERAVSLYRGGAEEDLWAIAPYLAQADGALLDWIEGTLAGQPWGIFVFSDADLGTLRRHFRRFLIVEDPDGGEMYFRFYDPRVLRKFLPVCTSLEVRELFGPVEAYAIPADPGEDGLLLRERRDAPPSAIYRPGKNHHFRVRPAHRDAFSAEAAAAFETRLMDYLRQEHAAVVPDLPDDLLREMVHYGLDKARSYGLTWESNLTAFVALMFEIAPNFDTHPFIRHILTLPHVPPDARLDVLMERTDDRVWEEAEARYDADAWFPGGELGEEEEGDV